METRISQIINTISNNKKEFFLIAIILLLAAFLRFYKIREYVVFLGDEGRDALVVKRMIVDHDFTLLGPTASVGGFYLGPIYYYFMIPFLWLASFDPVGPAIMVALLGVISVGLLYWFMRKWTNPISATLATLLYATAPGVVRFSRSSWNPNIMPFFALLSIFALASAFSEKKKLWLFIAGASYGVAIQSHYLGLILGPILALATLTIYDRNQWLKSALVGITGFITGASMFLAFEVRHGFPNTRTIFEFVTRGGNTTGPISWNLAWLFLEMLRRTFESVFFEQNFWIKTISLLGLVGFLFYLSREKKKKKGLSAGLKVTTVWFIIGLFGIGLYKGQLYPHYFGFLFPLPFILLGTSIGMLFKKRTGKIIGLAVTIGFLYLNLTNLPIWGKGSNLINQTKDVAQEIIKVTANKPFNFALLSMGNSDHAYRYFLEISGHKPIPLEEMVTEQLIVVCESLEAPCQPLGHPLWEVAGFGRAEIVEETTVDPGITIIKLTHHQDSLELIGQPAPKGG